MSAGPDPMLRFASLGSGSGGNATLVGHGDTLVMVDCGFGLRDCAERLEKLGVSPDQLSAVLVTHEHNDHSAGVAKLARKYRLPVFTTSGTVRACEKRWAGKVAFELELISPEQTFEIGSLNIRAYPVPHDALEPCQFVFAAGSRRLGILSDAGWVTPFMVEALLDCDALLLEANHDESMLEAGPYPDYLKARVGGHMGHLSNRQAAGLVAELDCSKMQHLVVAHISEKNNTAALAQAAVAEAAMREKEWIGVANQDQGFGWREIA